MHLAWAVSWEGVSARVEMCSALLVQVQLLMLATLLPPR